MKVPDEARSRKFLGFYADRGDASRLERVAVQLDVSMSHLLRRGVRAVLAELAEAKGSPLSVQ